MRMAYKLERESGRTIELEVDGEILQIPVKGMAVYRKVLDAQGRLKDIQTKIDNLGKNGNGITHELVEFLGQSVIYLFNVAFGEQNTQKILDFYEGNYDEMLLKVYPFFLSVYLPALKDNAKAESQAYAKRLAGAS